MIMHMLKKQNARPRPFVQHPGLVIPLFTVSDFSYPSGHSLGSELQARLLSELFPDHAPALLGPDFKTAEWREFRPEQLPDIFSRCQAVCWNCHVTETFRRLHPELVVDRPFEPRRMM